MVSVILEANTFIRKGTLSLMVPVSLKPANFQANGVLSCFSFLKSAAPRPEDMSKANCSGNTHGCQVIHPGRSCWKSSLQPVIAAFRDWNSKKPRAGPSRRAGLYVPRRLSSRCRQLAVHSLQFQGLWRSSTQGFLIKKKSIAGKAHVANEHWLFRSRRIKVWRSADTWNLENGNQHIDAQRRGHFSPTKTPWPQRFHRHQDQLMKSHRMQQKMDSALWRFRQE